MRKIVILILILLALLFTSIIVVDERENAVITGKNGSQRVESTGIHFTWPIWDSIVYVFTNGRTALLSLAVNNLNDLNNQLQVEVLINYKVIDPAMYLSAIHKSEISTKMAGILLEDLKRKITATTLDKLNQGVIFFSNPSQFNALGISVEQVHLLNIKFTPLLSVNTNVPTSQVGSKNIISIESAYYQASIVKSKTKLDTDAINHTMQIKDPKFYEYFKTLKMYEQNAKTKADVPPLSSLGN